MKIRHGRLVLGWDEDFDFQPPNDCDCDSEIDDNTVSIEAIAVGAVFLSGRKRGFAVYVDENRELHIYQVDGPAVRLYDVPLETLIAPWALCGPGALEIARNLCKSSGATGMSFYPLGDFSELFGCMAGAMLLARKEKPRMTRFCTPYEEEIEGCEAKPYNSDLDGDVFGRMAFQLINGNPVVNQVMQTPCQNVFFNRVLSVDRGWGKPVFLMTPDMALKYFPLESILYRNYCAQWVPVPVKNTQEFIKKTGFDEEDVDIFVASELTPGLGTFLRFVKTMGNIDFVASSCPKDMNIPLKIPLFRSHGAYNITKEVFKEIFYGSTREIL